MSIINNETWDQFCDYIPQVLEENNMPGTAVGILHNGDRKMAGFGVTNVQHPLVVTDDTLFQIGSITKTFTGTAMMRLVESGQVDLDVPITTYIPDFAVQDETAAMEATIRHLFTHLSGWVGDYFDDTSGGDDALVKYVTNMAELPQLAPLGKVWSYNNAGFSVAGRIIEVITKKPFHTAMQELVLTPLGLERAYLDPTDAMPHRFVAGHTDGDNGPEIALPWPLSRCTQPMGGIITDIQSLLTYAQLHLDNGRASNGEIILKSETIKAMQTPQASVWSNLDWGLTWAIDTTGGIRQIWHSGGTVGQISLLVLVPERNFAFGILTNAYSGRQVTNELRRWILHHFLGVKMANPEPLTVSEAELATYEGTYKRPFATIDIGLLGGRLIAQITTNGGFPTKDTPPRPSPPPMTVAMTGKDQLSVIDGPLKGNRLEVVRDDAENIGWIRFGSRIHRKQA
ncbi:MAG: serine hydrolase domain-containing protein [Chloroflexota bacterium]